MTFFFFHSNIPDLSRVDWSFQKVYIYCDSVWLICFSFLSLGTAFPPPAHCGNYDCFIYTHYVMIRMERSLMLRYTWFILSIEGKYSKGIRKMIQQAVITTGRKLSPFVNGETVCPLIASHKLECWLHRWANILFSITLNVNFINHNLDVSFFIQFLTFYGTVLLFCGIFLQVPLICYVVL